MKENIGWSEGTPKNLYGDCEGVEIVVFRQCPNCGRFLTTGKVLQNKLCEVKLQGWFCSKCGEVEPEWMRTA